MNITPPPKQLPKDFYVYLHIKADADPADDESIFYVGYGQKRRAWATTRNPFWKAVCAKHGCRVWILSDSLSQPEAAAMEADVVAQYWVSGAKLTNMTTGGEGVANLSDEAKERKRIGISQAKKGKPISNLLRLAISKAHKGRIMSEQHRARLSEAARSHRSELQNEAARRAGMKKAKPVQCVETGSIHLSTHAAARWLRSVGFEKAISAPIRRVCTGRSRTAYGFTWRYSK